MELARICAMKQPYATMIFAATAGEEQDLYGAQFLADTLKNASVNVEANLNNDIVGTGSNEPFNPINQVRLQCHRCQRPANNGAAHHPSLWCGD